FDHPAPRPTSPLVGSPDPPLPFAVEQTFTKIKWHTPIFIVPEPGADALWVALNAVDTNRPARILRVRDDPATDQSEIVLDLTNRFAYSFTFHPGYQTNGYIFLFLHAGRTNVISRFTVERPLTPTLSPNEGEGGARRCDPGSEHVIIEWHSEGHDGGGIVFGHDGMLYISSGDGTSDSD